MRRTTTTLIATAVMSATTLTGCSKAGSTTCQEFNAQSISDQTSTIRSLLKQHDLDPDSITNVTELTKDVSAYCRNGSSGTLENATDWESPTW